MYKKLKLNFILDATLLLLVSLIPLIWFQNNTVLMGHDSGWTLVPIDRFVDRLYVWTKTGFGYDQSIDVGTLTIYLLPTFLSLLKFSVINIQKITYIFWFFMIGFSMYTFVRTIFSGNNSRLIALTASIFYMINHYTLQAWIVAELSKFSAMTLFPFSLAILWKLIDKKISFSKAAILLSFLFLFFNAGGGSGIPLMAGMGVGLSVLFLFKLLVEKKPLGLLIRSYFLFGILFLLINTYWLLPLTSVIFSQYSPFAASGGPEAAVGWTDVISRNTSFINLFRLQGFSSWYDEPTHPYASVFLNNPFFIILSLVLPLLVFSSIFLAKDKKDRLIVLFFLIIVISSIFFVAGTHHPLGFIYEWMMKNIYGFAIFRTAFYKFGYALWFSYAFLFAFASIRLISIFKNKLPFYIGLFFIIFFIFLYNFPFFTGSFFEFKKPFNTRITLPQYIFEAKNYVSKMPNNSRILLIPPPSPINGQTDIYNFGYFSRTPLPYQLTQKSIVTNVEINSSPQESLTEDLYTSIIENNEDKVKSLFQLLGVNHILSRGDVLLENREYPIRREEEYLNILQNYKWVKLDREIGKWKFYKLDLPSELFGLLAPPANIVTGNYTQGLSHLLDGRKENEVIVEKKYEHIFPTNLSNIIVAECVNCIELDRLKTEKAVPRFLPTSPLYLLVKIKEKRNLGKASNDNFSYLRLLLIYSQKRAFEISLLVRKQESIENKDVIDEEQKSKLFENYLLLLGELREKYNLLSEEEKLRTLREYIDSINIQISLIEGIRTSTSDFQDNIEEEYNRVLDSLYKLNEDEDFRKGLRLNESYYVYSAYIPEDGDYELKITENTSGPAIIDNENYFNSDKVFLKKGEYILNLPISVERLIQMGEIIDVSNKIYNLSLDNLKPEQRYTFSFEYNVLPNSKVKVEVIDGFGNRLFSTILNGRGSWKKEEFSFSTRSSDQSYKIAFVSNTKNIKEEAFIKNIEISKKILPTVILTNRKSLSSQFEPPKMKVDYINPTKYLITIKNSKDPFVLLFKESFSPFWQANFKDGKLIESHFPQAEAFNAWYVDRTGNFQIELNFRTQKIFYFGTIVSVLTLLILLGTVFVKNAIKR